MNEPFQKDLLRRLQGVESRAGEIADALDAGDERALHVPGEDGRRRLCIGLAAAAECALRVLHAVLASPDGVREPGPMAARTPGSVSAFRDLVWAPSGPTLEWLIVPDGVDPDALLPSNARRIACYAAPGQKEGHVVHVDAILPSASGPSTIRQLLIGRTELGPEHALAVAALCAALMHDTTLPAHDGARP
jgi:hypothetical protein